MHEVFHACAVQLTVEYCGQIVDQRTILTSLPLIRQINADFGRPVMQAVDSLRLRAAATASSRSNVAMHCTDGINFTGFFAVL